MKHCFVVINLWLARRWQGQFPRVLLWMYFMDEWQCIPSHAFDSHPNLHRLIRLIQSPCVAQNPRLVTGTAHECFFSQSFIYVLTNHGSVHDINHNKAPILTFPSRLAATLTDIVKFGGRLRDMAIMIMAICWCALYCKSQNSSFLRCCSWLDVYEKDDIHGMVTNSGWRRRVRKSGNDLSGQRACRGGWHMVMTKKMRINGSETCSREITATALNGRWRSEMVVDDGGRKRSSDDLDSAELFLRGIPVRTVHSWYCNALTQHPTFRFRFDSPSTWTHYAAASSSSAALECFLALILYFLC